MIRETNMGIIKDNLAKLIVVCALFLGVQVSAKNQDTVDYEVYVNQIVNSFAKQMKKEYGLVCIGEGGSMPYNVREISVKFIHYSRASIKEARALEVKATERLLEMINAHEKIRPFLSNYPFKPYQAEVAISFRRKENNDYYYDGSVVRVTQIKNTIFYKDKDEKSPLYITLAKEPYEEALKIVQASEHENH